MKTVKESVAGRLSGLKFMQRARIREEEFKKQEVDEVGGDDSHWVVPAAGAASSRCKVIVEGDPKPGALIGRMSFQNCNPVVERIVEEVQARRERVRNAGSISSGVEERPAISTPQASANGVEQLKVEVDDVENMSMRKRQKVEKRTVTQNGEVKVERSTFFEANCITPLRGGKNENDREEKQQHRGTKQVNPRTDWRNLRPPGR